MKKKNFTFAQLILFYVKLGFSTISIPQQIIKARRIISMMTDNDNFPTPSPTLVELTEKTDALEDAEAAMDGRKIKTVERDAALKLFAARFQAAQFYVEQVALGNTEIILSSGFEVASTNRKPADLAAPINFLAKSGLPLQIDLSWKPVKGAKLYIVEMCSDIMNPNWNYVAQATKAKVSVTDLNPGQLYFFRVVAVNANGFSPWSDISDARPNFN